MTLVEKHQELRAALESRRQQMAEAKARLQMEEENLRKIVAEIKLLGLEPTELSAKIQELEAEIQKEHAAIEQELNQLQSK